MATPSRLVRTSADLAAATASRARVFIGSSTKSRPIAERMASLLGVDFDVTPWWTAFPPGDLTLETLLEARSRYDCALPSSPRTTSSTDRAASGASRATTS